MPPSPPIVLVAARDDAVLRAVGDELPEGRYAPLAARSWAQVEGSLGSIELAAAIVHYQLEDIDPMTFSRRLRELPGRSRLPIVILLPGVGRAPREGEPFDVAMQFPCGPGVLADNLTRAIARADERLRTAIAELKSEVIRLLHYIDRKSYYEILGVPPTAGHDAIVAAYDTISLRYHPDRLKQLKDANIRRACERFYSLVAEAHQVLTSMTNRRRYDAGLAEGSLRFDPETSPSASKDPTDIAKGPQAKRHLRTAEQQIAQGKPEAALVYLKLALSSEPDNDALKSKIDALEKSK